MRFIAKYAAYQTCFKRDIVEEYASGGSSIRQPLWNCAFKPDRWLEHEAKAARAVFLNFGMPVEPDGVTAIDPVYRFSVFDTEEYQAEHKDDMVYPPFKPFDDEMRVELEQWLLNHADYGNAFIMVEAPRLEPPWPKYDEFRGVRGMPTGQRVAERVLEDGYDILEVLAYERANKNRSDVVDALEALLAPEPADDSVLVVA